ncbi:hypothetical protein AWB95_21425 [Mycobacterium celatum]|uniref:Uncharacterized protein n=1 Tax=Mycobacterium celatum TaxID=28045 RepID=A0A1X1RIQ6_MYCCE|nr:hypothetical protein AWB95_21425 [Mycobacterium celatum]
MATWYKTWYVWPLGDTALKFDTIGVAPPWMASSVAVASHSVPCGWYGMLSELGFRSVTVQP